MASHNLSWTLLLAITLFNAASVFGCLCPFANTDGLLESQVQAEVERSTAVFTGRLIGHEYRDGMLYDPTGRGKAAEQTATHETQLLRFEVDRWWKGPLSKEILIITDIQRPKVVEETDALPRGVAFGMCKMQFIKDVSYLVYAFGPIDNLQYRVCNSRDAPIAKAAADIKVLGKGKKPLLIKDDL